MALRLTVSEERSLIAGSFSRRMFWAWPPCLRASAPSVDGFRLKAMFKYEFGQEFIISQLAKVKAYDRAKAKPAVQFEIAEF